MSDTPKADTRFNDFVYLQAQNAGLFLGQLPHPSTGETSKTKGNLTTEESSLLEKALLNIRALYANVEDLG